MRRFTAAQIAEMAQVLKEDGVISVPTDTVYGVCARMDSLNAQEHLRNVKHRPLTKAFPLMCADLKQIEAVAQVDARSRRIIEQHMPGPLTVVLKKKEEVPPFVNGGMETLAIRMATSDTLKELIQAVGCPVYMTSANQSGLPVCTSLDEIEKQCPDLDGMLEGSVDFHEASTIADLTHENIRILRQGPVTLEELEENEHA
ncbi:MAG: threonylcarbamoyl-AMP synthase [Solobacterium sp.]|nr:threonylcarbamoyl-AMP synthase [Solobacterium sp.]